MTRSRPSDIESPRRPPEGLSPLRSHILACVCEFAGTFMYLFLAFTLHLGAISQLPPEEPPTRLIQFTILFAYSMFYGTWLFITALMLHDVRGGLFSPAITLGLVLIGSLSVVRGLLLVPMQLLAGVSAAAVVRAINPGDLRRVQTLLTPGVTVGQGFFLEVILTTFLIVIALFVIGRNGHTSLWAPLAVGLVTFLASFAGVGYTGASLNPIRAFAPSAAIAEFPEYHWIYWASPLVAALIAAMFGWLIGFLRSGHPRSHGSDSDDFTVPPEAPSPPSAVPVVRTPRRKPRGLGIHHDHNVAPRSPIQKTTTITQVSSHSPGGRSFGDEDEDLERGEIDVGRGGNRYSRAPEYMPVSHHRRVSSGGQWGDGFERRRRESEGYERGRESGGFERWRNSDMDRYERARGFEKAMA